jgi:hypothetical protein
MARAPTRVTTPKSPTRMKLPAPKATTPANATPPMRRPVASAGGKDVVSVVTRMRETPTKRK